ncbi:MAG: hypothetical protein HRT88_09650 [Lentisphaeraceae bacterium]|nr:hypothetical protein [Lentisphaeraceae bacterium]
MKKIMSILLLIFFLNACSNVTELVFSKKNNISALFFKGGNGDATILVIGSVDEPYDGNPVVKLRVSEKIIFDSSDKTPEKMAEYLSKYPKLSFSHASGSRGHPSPRSLRSKKRWGSGAYTVDIYDSDRQWLRIIQQANEIRSIRIDDWSHKPDKNIIEIKVGNSPWCSFRLSRDECITLFGQPNAESRYFVE